MNRLTDALYEMMLAPGSVGGFQVVGRINPYVVINRLTIYPLPAIQYSRIRPLASGRLGTGH